MIQYRYALDENFNIVHIEDINETNAKENYICGECGERLAPRALDSQYKSPHFYHLSKERACSGESYLHWISKHLLAKAFGENRPFVVEWKSRKKCLSTTNEWLHSRHCFKDSRYTIDLVEKYPFVEIERRDGSFIPDISLRSRSGERIYIEIFHSSAMSEEKRKSGNKIIEIAVKSEEAIRSLIDRRVLSRGPGIELVGFEPFEAPYDCKGECQHLKNLLSPPTAVKKVEPEVKVKIEKTPGVKRVVGAEEIYRDLQKIIAGGSTEKSRKVVLEMIPYYNSFKTAEKEADNAFPHFEEMLRQISKEKHHAFEVSYDNENLWRIKYRGKEACIANIGLYYFSYRVEEGQIVPGHKSRSHSKLCAMIRDEIDNA